VLAVEPAQFSGTSSQFGADVDGTTRPRISRRLKTALSSVRFWMGALAAGMLCAGLLVHRSTASAAIGELGSISPSHLALLIAVVLLHKAAHASVLWSSLPGLSMRRALVVNEIHVGCSNSAIGGGAVGTGLKVSMLRSDGRCERAIAASILMTGVAASFGVWLMAWGQSVPRVVLGDAKGGELLVVAAGTVVLVGSTIMWWAILTRPRVVSVVVRIAEAIRPRIARVLPRPIREPVLAVDLPAEASRLQGLGLSLLRDRLWTIVGCSLAGQASISLVLVTSLFVLEPAGGVPIISVLGVFAVARVAGSLAPLPGGLGVLDVGLVSGLTHVGISEPTALAATALFRALTFFLPIATGFLCLMMAKRSSRRSERA
jgi:putative heme transporter